MREAGMSKGRHAGMIRLAILTAAAVLLAASPVRAGGGPENVVVVVNGDSWASLTIANEFIRLRQIPPDNVIILHNLPDIEQVTVEDFRSAILGPVLKAIEKRGLREQIDYVVYSSDLPTAIDYQQDIAGHTPPKGVTPLASINGLTYLYGYVQAKDVEYLRLDVNRYMRRRLPLADNPQPGEAERKLDEEATKLINEKKWADAAKLYRQMLKERPRAAEAHYNLACCLSRMEKPDEAMAELKAAVEAGWSDAAFIDDDDDLAALRQREDFKQLVKGLRERQIQIQETRGFRNAYAWSPDGKKSKKKGPHYLLSTVLAVTSGRGNSVHDALESLRRSATADGTHPKGAVYYVVNGDIRSATRQGAFPAAVAALKGLGVAAEIVQGILPDGKADVIGAMIGTAGFDWAASKSTILPGAICEHLTSCGGMMGQDAGQTPLTEFIRFGAAGSSGTVNEPYAIQAKFPFPFLHVHYARGCTLAEAFYQSVFGPYQLLIVGDPLCRPWARIPQVAVDGVKADETVVGKVILRPKPTDKAAPAIGRYELFIDGRRRLTGKPDQSLELETTELADGFHELRVVAVSADPIETQGRAIVPIEVRNHGHAVSLDGPTEKRVPWDQSVKLKARAEGAKRITVHQNGRKVGEISGSEGEVEVDPQRFGAGMVQVQAIAEFGPGPQGLAASRPVPFEVVAPKPRQGAKMSAKVPPIKGLKVSPEKGAAVTVEDTRPADWLTKAGLKAGQAFVLEGYFDVPAEDVYQLQLRGEGRFTVSLDGTKLKQPPDTGKAWRFLPVSLAAGTHRLQVRGKVPKDAHLELRFGGPGAHSLGASQFHYPAGKPGKAEAKAKPKAATGSKP